MIKKVVTPLLLSVFLISILFFSFKSVQARRFFAVDGATSFDVVRVCQDGMEVGFARTSDSVPLTSVFWHGGGVLIVSSQDLTLPYDPVVTPNGTVDYSGYFTLHWENSILLVPGDRIIMYLNVGNNPQPIWATVQDCTVDDGQIAAESFIFPDPYLLDDANGGPINPIGETLFTITVAMTETVGDVNVAFFVDNGESPTETLNLSAWLTSPQGTTVQLINNVADDGQDFGFRCRKENDGLYGDPLADLVFDDVSTYDFTTEGIFGEYEMFVAIRPLESLGTFKGEDGNGEWELKFQNLTPAVSAYLNCWMLQIAIEPPSNAVYLPYVISP